MANDSSTHSYNTKGTREAVIEEHRVNISVAVFSVISVTIGAGMVAVPKASYESGIPWAIGYNIMNFIM